MADEIKGGVHGVKTNCLLGSCLFRDERGDICRANETVEWQRMIDAAASADGEKGRS